MKMGLAILTVLAWATALAAGTDAPSDPRLKYLTEEELRLLQSVAPQPTPVPSAIAAPPRATAPAVKPTPVVDPALAQREIEARLASIRAAESIAASAPLTTESVTGSQRLVPVEPDVPSDLVPILPTTPAPGELEPPIPVEVIAPSTELVPVIGEMPAPVEVAVAPVEPTPAPVVVVAPPAKSRKQVIKEALRLMNDLEEQITEP